MLVKVTPEEVTSAKRGQGDKRKETGREEWRKEEEEAEEELDELNLE